jgi:hypothetical protein
LPPPGTGKASAAASNFIATEIKENPGKSITDAAEELATQLIEHWTMSLSRRALFLLTTNLVIPKK